MTFEVLVSPKGEQIRRNSRHERCGFPRFWLPSIRVAANEGSVCMSAPDSSTKDKWGYVSRPRSRHPTPTTPPTETGLQVVLGVLLILIVVVVVVVAPVEAIVIDRLGPLVLLLMVFFLGA